MTRTAGELPGEAAGQRWWSAGPWRSVTGYALASAVVVVSACGLLSVWLSGPSLEAVWVGGALAYLIQVVAFGLLMVLRRGVRGFLLAWAGGTLLRFAVVLGGGFWLVRTLGYPPLALLLSLAGFVFALLLLEPVFFRVGATTR